MMLEFLQDYCGRETAMKELKKGERALVPAAQAMELIRLGIAFEIDEQIEVTSLTDEKPVFISTVSKKKSKRSEPLRDGGEA